MWVVSEERGEWARRRREDGVQNARLRLTYQVDEAALEARERLDGLYVLRTSLGPDRSAAVHVAGDYRSLHQAERAFRHIKSYLPIRPVYPWRVRRIRAHVLICFLAYYLVKGMEQPLRAVGESTEVEHLLQRWNRLRLVEFEVRVGDRSRTGRQWMQGRVGKALQQELEGLGWWKAVETQRRRLEKHLPPLP